MTNKSTTRHRDNALRDTFLAIKYTIPPLHTPELLRHRLISQVNEGARLKLTVITAPGGYGKTTLLSQWASRVPNKVAWLSLDNSDNDPSRFLKGLLAALQTVNGHIGEEVFPMLRAEKKTTLEKVLKKMVDDIGMVLQDFVLVIDNFQLLHAEPVLQILAFLLIYLPPQIHLIISSRKDIPYPLYDLRSGGQLKEIRSPHLTFTMEEASAFFNQVMALKLPFGEVSALLEKTRGRPWELKYTAHCIQQYKRSSDFFEDFEKVPPKNISTFLADTLLTETHPETREFLQQTAILEYLCESLCQEVTSRPKAGEMLRGLAKDGKFIFPAERQRHWYRFDPGFQLLFQERLRRNLASSPSDLHQCAGRWFAGHHLIEPALYHAVAAKDLNLVGQIIEEHAMNMLKAGELKTLERWLNALTEEHIAAHPMLSISKAWIAVVTNQLEDLEALLKSAFESRFKSSKPQQIAEQVQLIRDYLFRWRTTAEDS